MAIKSKTIMYPNDTLDQKRLKNMKPETLQLSVEPESHISDSIENIIKDQSIDLYHLLSNPEDQIL